MKCSKHNHKVSIDMLTFTFKTNSLLQFTDDNISYIGDDTLLKTMGAQLMEIGALSIGERKGKGNRFYQNCYQLVKHKPLGMLHFGGQNQTICVELNGKACQAMPRDWQQRLFDFMQKLDGVKITRIDLAYDFFDNSYSPEQALQDLQAGCFNKRGKIPNFARIETKGSAKNRKGSTTYVGSSNSDVMVRIYDKAAEQKIKNQNWVRFELQFKGKKQLLPLEMLLHPDEYFFNYYPEFWFEKLKIRSKSNDILKKKRHIEMSVNRAVAVAKRQTGRIIRFLKDVGYSDADIINKLCADAGEYPRGLSPVDYDLSAEKLINGRYVRDDVYLNISPILHGESEIKNCCERLKNLKHSKSLPANKKKLIKEFEQTYHEWRVVKQQIYQLNQQPVPDSLLERQSKLKQRLLELSEMM